MTDRAKQSQTWEGWGIWGKANVAGGAVQPESGACETKPIRPGHGEKRLTASLRTGPVVLNKANFRIAEKQALFCMVV